MRLTTIAIALIVLNPASASAVGPGVIEGRLVQGTEGGGAVGGISVALLTFRGEQEQERRSTTASGDGAFRFEGLETSAGYTYQVVAPFGNVEYGGTPIVFDNAETTRQTELRLYEATEADPGLSIEWAMVVIDQVERSAQTLNAYELLMISNPSDRTFLPSTTGPAGPMGLLRFSLPHGAGQLAPGPGLGANDLFQVDRGFASTDPIPPGRHELSFRYVVPYQASSFAFERTAVYDTAELWVLVRDDGPTIFSEALSPEQPITLSGVTYRLQVARDLAAGSRIPWQINDLPTRSIIGLPFDVFPTQVWGAGAIALALGIVVFYVWQYGVHRTPQTADAPPDPAARLLNALVALDEERAAGRLEASEHERRREALKAALREVYLAEHRLPARET
jgi:hypothetical protein